MRWEDERYVRVYTRDTPEWVALGWEAQGLFMQLIRKCDRAGILELGRTGVRGLAIMLRMPEEVTERALAALLDDGCVVRTGTTLVIANYVEAQEATSTNRLRKEMYNERLKLKKQALEQYSSSQDGTNRNAEARDGTPYRTTPCCTNIGSARAPEPSADGGPQDQGGASVEPELAIGGPETAQGAPGDPPVAIRPFQAQTPPVKAKRGPKEKTVTVCPSSDASGDEVKAWLAKWKIVGDVAEVEHFLDYHRSKGNSFKDWGAAWRTWQRNGTRFGRVAQVPLLSPPPKPIPESSLFLAMDRLRNLKPGEKMT